MEKNKEDGNELSPFQPIKLFPLDARITDTNFAPITWVSIKDIEEAKDEVICGREVSEWQNSSHVPNVAANL